MMEGRSRGHRAAIMALAVAIALLGADICYQGVPVFPAPFAHIRHKPGGGAGQPWRGADVSSANGRRRWTA